jgi:hypothetical protein
MPHWLLSSVKNLSSRHPTGSYLPASLATTGAKASTYGS